MDPVENLKEQNRLIKAINADLLANPGDRWLRDCWREELSWLQQGLAEWINKGGFDPRVRV